MHLLGCLFTFVFIIVIAAFVMVRNVLSTFLGGLNRGRKRAQDFFGGEPTNDKRTATGENIRAETRKESAKGKIISDDEGEYVDFEEIK